jgi:hypothetical protein
VKYDKYNTRSEKMRKIEIVEEELLIVKQALSLYKEKLDEENTIINRADDKIVDSILTKIKDELKKQI